jgi:hypothetical protein
MGFLDFFSRRRPALEPTLLTTERLEAAIEAVVDRVNPKLRLASDYQARLGPAIERFLVAAREDVSRIPAPHLATPDAWVRDPDLHAFFATAQDLVALVSRARQVKELFRAQPGADTAYGLLGMSVESRQVFGTELQGDMVRQDVPQETLSFGDHRINLVAADEAALRQTLVRALGEQVLIEALAEMDLAKARLKRLRDERSLLASQLRVLQSRSGMLGAVGSAGEQAEALAAAKAALAAQDTLVREAGGGAGALDAQLDTLAKLIADPHRAVHFELREVRLSRMNIVVPENGGESAATVRYVYVSAGAAQRRAGAIALLCIPRTAVRRLESRVAEAARTLG